MYLFKNVQFGLVRYGCVITYVIYSHLVDGGWVGGFRVLNKIYATFLYCIKKRSIMEIFLFICFNNIFQIF